MDIVIDISSLVTPHLTGVGVYEKQLLEGLQSQLSAHQIRPVYKFSRWKKANLLNNHLNSQLMAMVRSWGPWNDLFQSRNSIFHGPDCRLISNGKGRKVVTIHDLQPFYNEWWENSSTPHKMQSEFKNLLTQKIDHIIVPTESVKTDLTTFFPTLKTPVTVIYHGGDHIQKISNTQSSDRLKLLNLENGFILCLGTLELRKNQGRLIKAYFELANQSQCQIPLIIAGGMGHGANKMLSEFQSEIDWLTNKGLLHFLGKITDAEKDWLLYNCTGFAYPSLYEGFGIPLIEAMIAGKPLLTSNYGAMAEVAGDKKSILVDPRSINDLSAGISKLMTSSTPDWASHLEKFTWKKSIYQHIEIYQDLAK